MSDPIWHPSNLPTPGGSANVWGNMLNTVLNAISDFVKVVKETADGALQRSGGEMEGPVHFVTDTFEPVDLETVGPGNVVLDFAEGRFFHMVVEDNITIQTGNTPDAGKAIFIVIEIEMDGDPAHTVTWPASFEWAGGSAPAFTADGVDVVVAYSYDGGATWRATVALEDVS